MSRTINKPEQSASTYTASTSMTAPTITATTAAELARLQFTEGSELTISGGAITVTNSYHPVDTENNDATDDLSTINGGVDGQILVLSAASSLRTVVVKDTATIKLAGDFSMDHADDRIMLIYRAVVADWFEISRSDNAT